MDIYRNTNVISGFLWRLMERMGAQIVSFVVSIVLARILDPNAYGTVALITVFTTIMQVFVDSGLGNALIQKKDADDTDFSTVFYVNIVFCCSLYALMWVAAPLIAGFYRDPLLVPYIRVLSLTIVVSGIKNVQQAYVSRNMLFKKFFFATLGGTIGAAVIGITMALNGFGVWALIAQQLFNLTVDTLILWITVPWRPKRLFSWERLGTMFSYGWKLLVSTLLDTGYNNLRQLLIGRVYTRADLAYYNQGDKFPTIIIVNINQSIDSVLLPAMSHDQDDRTRVRDMTRRAIKISTYMMGPLLAGMAACADSIVHLILTDKWILCVPYMRIFCICYMLFPIHTANLNAIKAMGRSDIFLKLEIIKKVVGFAVLIVSIRISVMAMAWSLLIASIISMAINAWPNREFLGYDFYSQMKDIFPNLMLASIMAILVYLEGRLIPNALLRLILQIPSGAVIYLILSIITRNDSFQYLMVIIRSKMRNRKNS